jgi:hypothetical protein
MTRRFGSEETGERLGREIDDAQVFQQIGWVAVRVDRCWFWIGVGQLGGAAM